MSDYDPMKYDKYGNDNRHQLPPVGDGTTSGYVLIALLAAIGVVGGALYFSSSAGRNSSHTEQAQAPDMSTTTTTPSLPGPASSPAAPRVIGNPAPTNPPASVEHQ